MSTTERNRHLREIEDIEKTPEALHRLLHFTRDPRGEIRMRAVEKLGEFELTSFERGRLAEMLEDPDPLVRVEVVETLALAKEKSLVSRIARLLDDENGLVRGACALALGRLAGRRFIPALRKRLRRAEGHERASFLAALALLGERGALPDFLTMLQNPDYRARCATANLAVDLADGNTRAQILAALIEALAGETTRAARSSIESSISKLQNQKSG